jgi:Fe-S oxidoreductase
MDFLSCVECNRCTDHCPAHISGQELDPRGFILQGRQAIYTLDDAQPVIGNVITEAALGQCTSCGACEASCPVGIEHLQVLTGAKRAQALAIGTGMMATDYLQKVERTGNAFGQAAGLRQELIEALGMPIYEPGQTDYLLWLGCVWAYNPDVRRSLESMVTILKTAGVSFGVLENETCTGHHARCQGEEMQFQTLAEQNIDAIQNAQVDTIIAPCPHCLHTISRDYPALQDDFQPRIIHHSQLMAELLATGKITMDSDKLNGKTTTYHDPCYLGRYERVYDEPRDLIIKAGLNLVEMQRHGPTSMCCGGSAGFARDQDVERRVDQVRAEQVRDTGAEMLVVACPGCKMMLNTAVEETVDLAELAADAMVSENGAEIFPLR